MLQVAVAFVAVGMLTACASTPDVVYKYYPSRSDSTVTVTQAVDCNEEKTSLLFANVVTMNTAYSADIAKTPNSIPIKALDGVFADNDVQLNFFDDGRLKGINATTTGQGEVIAQSVIKFGTALAVLMFNTPLPECEIINRWGRGKPVSLIYRGPIDYESIAVEKAVDIQPTPDSEDLYEQLNGILNLPKLKIGIRSVIESGAIYASPSSQQSNDTVKLVLQQVESVPVEVWYHDEMIWGGKVIIPGQTTYWLPIPKPALFGKQSFSLTLSEAGAITSIGYGKTTGAAGPVNVAASAATAAAPETTAARAAEIKAQADLIAQEQRLIRCKAQPAQCQ